MSSHIRHRIAAASCLLAAASTLTACGGSDEDIGPMMGNATAAPPSAPSTSPAGKVVDLDYEVTNAVQIDDRILARAGDKVISGTPTKPAVNTTDIDPACGDLAPAGGVAVLPCPDGIHVLADDGSTAALVGRGTAYSSAVGLDDGRILGHRADSERLDVYGPGGELDTDFKASRVGSQLVPVPGDKDLVLEINSPETSIHELEIAEDRLGSSLRVGLGVAEAAVGDDGTIAVTDATGSQLMIYTATDVIRLHQSFPVPQSPWAVVVDNQRNLVWVSSTAEGIITGWDISSGQGVKVAELEAVTDPRAMVLSDGGLVVYSAAGDGVQRISATELNEAIAAMADTADQERELLAPGPAKDRLPTGATETTTPAPLDEN
ncbi:hypothetical protein KRX51_05920 [Corynebacterium sp. TAE3-ERU12]|uniref:hypothetical protein n=1 Tax=Corynebacterium sp. TAE3-ERU12 TaxID=2849491 RepID=UPI001C495477|nr:hypothetical protein [Corynebacterium sp. TAE3-ERU12]MBV7295455.1 hypothetical protein [Corynebacterium sp. TAE3-ERU12]